MNFQKNQYIKRTGKLPNFKYWYWNSKENRLFNKFGKPELIIALSNPHYIHHPDDLCRYQKPWKTPLQVGDIVYYWRKNVFGEILEHIGNASLLLKARNSETYLCRRQSLYFLDANVAIQADKIEENLMLAQKKAEIDFAESIIGTHIILNYMMGKKEYWYTIPLNIDSFKLIHKLMFGHLYRWAGKYRKEALYVGRFNSKTLPFNEIQSEMRSLFKLLDQKILNESPFTLESMSNLLTSCHKDLAWIHPFKDGNGRAIRWFCMMIAYRLGFLLNFSFDTPKKRRKYHQAVRKSVEKGNSTYLNKIIKWGLSSKATE